MTNEERDIISQFIARVGGAPAASGFSQGGSVPTTQVAALPPVDRDADALIGQMFQRYPEAAYRMTQLAFVQEQGLIQAQNRVQQLEAQLAQAQRASQQQAQAPQGGGGFFSSLFGGGGQARPMPPPQYAPQPQYAPPPQYAPGYQPGMFQRSGSGFLGSALTTAAGVAGGMVAGNMLSNLLSGEHHMGGMPSGLQSGPWGAPSGVDQGPWGGGGTPAGNQDFVDSGSWDQPVADPPAAQDSSWSDNSSGGSWDSGGSDGGSSDSF